MFLRLTLVLGLAFTAFAAGPRVYLEPFPQKSGAAELQRELVSLLGKEHGVTVVKDAAGADFIVSGSGETYVRGYIGTNPRVVRVNSDSQPVYGGFLSVELKTQSQDTVWSYLATPSRIGSHDINRNLAGQVIRQLLVAMQAKQGVRPAVSQQAAEVLTGSGATFPGPLYEKWFATFLLKSPEIPITYRAVGSGAGIEALKKREVDFAASDAPLTADEMVAIPVKVRQIPTVIGGVVPAYHLEGVTGDLRFTPEILAGIYLGKIQQWNDPAIRVVNKGVALPARRIAVIHRSDASGTTYLFTGYLSQTSNDWKMSVGSGTAVKWPVGEGAAGNDGVAAAVANTPDSLGYVEFIYALRSRLTYGSIRNAAGRYVSPSLASLTAYSGPAAYPITGFTYLIVPETFASPERNAAMKSFLRWMLTSGQKQCASLGYAALPEDIAKKELEALR